MPASSSSRPRREDERSTGPSREAGRPAHAVADRGTGRGNRGVRGRRRACPMCSSRQIARRRRAAQRDPEHAPPHPEPRPRRAAHAASRTPLNDVLTWLEPPPTCHATRFTRDPCHSESAGTAPLKVPACIAIFFDPWASWLRGSVIRCLPRCSMDLVGRLYIARFVVFASRNPSPTVPRDDARPHEVTLQLTYPSVHFHRAGLTCMGHSRRAVTADGNVCCAP